MKTISCFLFIITFCISTFQSCKQNNKETSSVTYRTISPLRETKVCNVYDSIVDIEILCHLEESEGSFLGMTKKVLRSKDGKFVVVDYEDQILVFNVDGNFLRKIGSKGRQKNEYLKLEDVCWNSDMTQLLVLDFGKILHYNFETGKYLKTTLTPRNNYEAFAVAKNKNVYLFSSYPKDASNLKSKDALIHVADTNGKIVDELLPREDFIFTMALTTQNYDGVPILRPQDTENVVYKMNSDNLQPIFKIDLGNKSIPKHYIFEHCNDLSTREFMLSPYFKLPSYFFFTESLVYFKIAGPDAEGYNFVYDLDSNDGLQWKESRQESSLLQFVASSEKSFYAFVTPSAISQYDNDAPYSSFYRYVISELTKKKDFLRNSDNAIVVELKFDF